MESSRPRTETFMSGLASFHNSPHFSDVTLRLLDASSEPVYSLHAHKLILSAQSHFFATFFDDEIQQRWTPQIDIHDDDPTAFLAMLEYLYSGCYSIPTSPSSSRSSSPIELADPDPPATALLFHIRLHALATTYAIPTLQTLCATNFTLASTPPSSHFPTPAWFTAIELHYTLLRLPSSASSSPSPALDPMSLAIARQIYAHRAVLLQESSLEVRVMLKELLVRFPRLGVDVAGEARRAWKERPRGGTLGACGGCGRWVVAGWGEAGVCWRCGEGIGNREGGKKGCGFGRRRGFGLGR
ncbi:uncharacterized protein BDZ99DRAFT_500410 [Mytilinidion resinicola]|uniref:BTB domain-containing protein n=1 Tax=Mytilinidion resinicola TaxID=574789 RepID=A0A6A6YE80_9PEZI|nr:uncharacterized protein BDZ99DRAFT_500410 [Mytilinidion resinicola]KAF2807121.1 hypothetical protein BDZ99DRAFT_500410 [Mytilinidion resinicola]